MPRALKSCRKFRSDTTPASNAEGRPACSLLVASDIAALLALPSTAAHAAGRVRRRQGRHHRAAQPDGADVAATLLAGLTPSTAPAQPSPVLRYTAVRCLGAIISKRGRTKVYFHYNDGPQLPSNSAMVF